MSGKNKKSIFTSDEQRNLYRKLHKEYKAICFLLSIENELWLNSNVEELDCSAEDVVKARQKEIESIVSKWPEQIQEQFYNKIEFPTLMGSLPDSYRYDNIIVPYSYLDKENEIHVFNVKEHEKKTWEDIYYDCDSTGYWFYKNKREDLDWFLESYRQANRENELNENEYNSKRAEFEQAREKWDERKELYDDLMERPLIEKFDVLSDLPNCYMKTSLKYLQELIKTRQVEKISKKNKSSVKKGGSIKHPNFKSRQRKFRNYLQGYGLPEIDEFGNPERQSRSTDYFSLDIDVVDAAGEYKGQQGYGR